FLDAPLPHVEYRVHMATKRLCRLLVRPVGTVSIHCQQDVGVLDPVRLRLALFHQKLQRFTLGRIEPNNILIRHLASSWDFHALPKRVEIAYSTTKSNVSNH